MTRRRVWVLGAGKRVLDAALPALARAADRFELAGVYARTGRTVTVEGREQAVQPLDELEPGQPAAGDLVVMAVSKAAVPAVLERLARTDLSGVDLLIDTPVLLFKHLGHLGRLARFRSVSVAEDTVALPCWDPVRTVVESGAIGELRRAVFQQSAWAYHGFAMAKAVLGLSPVRRARRRRLEAPYAWRTARLANGCELLGLEPRDYAIGRMLLLGTRGSIADYPQREENQLLLEPIVEDDHCRGFRIGDAVALLDEAEQSLMGPARPGLGVTARMEDMKRVGFLRLLRQIGAGQGAYPLEQALDDSTVDWHLERFGRYAANPLTSPRFPTARLALGALTRLTRS